MTDAAVLYEAPVALETFRNKLLSVAADPHKPAATRAAIGLMARTTVEAGRYERHYEPFTDVWAPELMLELKSNHARLYGALEEAQRLGNDQRDGHLHPAVRVIRDRLYKERAGGSKAGAIQDAGALISELNQIEQPLTAADLDLAARYLRFDYGATGELDPKSPWSRLATHYVRLYEAGSANDYERLATILNELDKPS